ncbi:MAG: hypothetical protein KI786_04915, partial [Mameliella sp.]|nr:hypothetical protein [Phaeodactylibacter sp.]
MQLFKTETQRVTHHVVYDIYFFAEKLYLPTAYIVSADQEGYLAHIKQKALKDTIKGFELELTPTRDRLFDLIEQLQPKLLAEKFRPNKRSKPSLEKLLADRELSGPIYKYVHTRLAELLERVNAEGLYLTWEVERTVLAKDFVIETGLEPLVPQLFFKREAEGVHYRMQLADNEETWAIGSRDVVPITNHPAWLFVDYKLYQAPAINGNMVLPFQKKEEVHIPSKAVKTYFQKFILKVAAKSEITAEGFEVQQHNELQACILEPVQDLFSNQWVLSVQMAYPGSTFSWSDTKDKRTSLEFDEGDEVRILQAHRTPEAESEFLDKLFAHGLEVNSHKQLTLSEDSEDPFALLEWISENRSLLEQEGFSLKLPSTEGKSLYLHQPKIELKADQDNDWFDLKGAVTVGTHTFPFMKLAKYIRDGIRLFPLPDGQFFLIPQEWMARYKGLFQFGKRDKDQMRLAKSHFTLLQEMGISAGDEVAEERELASDFTPSDLLKADLRPYQLEGARWLVGLYESQLGGCLADDMGLGKTLQTITVLLHAKSQRAQRQQEAKASGQESGDGAQLGLFGQASDHDTLKP